jgi:ABC-type Zn uptake system ZnuABC Zn-binding protein ZnuA
VASDGVDAIRGTSTAYDVDPHFWFDLRAWEKAVDNVEKGLVELVGRSSSQSAPIRRRADDYRRRIRALHNWVESQIATIPQKHRVLITSHDAFAYFGRTYDIEVVGIQGISTEQEAGQRDVAEVIDLVRRKGAPAVFVETSVNPSLVKQVARSTGARVAGPLYSDSIGPADSKAATFVETVVQNVKMITEGLGGEYTPFRPSQDS